MTLGKDAINDKSLITAKFLLNNNVPSSMECLLTHFAVVLLRKPFELLHGKEWNENEIEEKSRTESGYRSSSFLENSSLRLTTL